MYRLIEIEIKLGSLEWLLFLFTEYMNCICEYNMNKELGFLVYLIGCLFSICSYAGYGNATASALGVVIALSNTSHPYRSPKKSTLHYNQSTEAFRKSSLGYRNIRRAYPLSLKPNGEITPSTQWKRYHQSRAYNDHHKKQQKKQVQHHSHQALNPPALIPSARTSKKPSSESKRSKPDHAGSIRKTNRAKGNGGRKGKARSLLQADIDDGSLDDLSEELIYPRKPEGENKQKRREAYQGAPESASGLDSFRFIATTDPQYDNGANDHYRNKISDNTMERISVMLDQDKDIKGVIVAGDLTQNARFLDEFSWYEHSINGMKLQVYDGTGNHDETPPDFWQRLACLFGQKECVSPSWIINRLRSRTRTEEICLHSEGAVYSWDWKGIHFVQLGVFAGNKPDKGGWDQWVSPEESLEFLQTDLKALPDKKTPVVIIMHFDVDFDVGDHGAWSSQQLVQFWESLAEYNIVMLISGHLHATCDYGVLHHVSRPQGATRGPVSLNAVLGGAALNGVFSLITINGTELTIERNCDGHSTGALATIHFSKPDNVSDSGKFDRKHCHSKPAQTPDFPSGWVAAGIAGWVSTGLCCLCACCCKKCSCCKSTKLKCCDRKKKSSGLDEESADTPLIPPVIGTDEIHPTYGSVPTDG